MNTEKIPQLVANMIRTPDGTILQSFHRHDYKEYTDNNGKTYMVDGGLSYLRRNVHMDAPYTELSLSVDDDFAKIRQNFCWGTYGIDGKSPLTWVSLEKMSSDHILNILKEIKLPEWSANLFKTELKTRQVEI
jgi:hypothetical protein